MTQAFFSELIDRYDSLKYEILKAQTFSEAHFGFPPIYYKVMETDRTRVRAFTKAFEQYDFTDKIVCEAGVGTLALTKHFLPQVKKAYLIEYNPELRDFIEKEIANNGWNEKVEVIYGDARQVVLPEPVDYIVGELMSIFCANELQVQIFKNLRQYLKPGGKLLPEAVTNIIQLANADFEAGHTHYPVIFMRHLPECLSLQAVVNTLDLYTVEEEKVETVIELMPILTGVVNSVYLRSFVEVAVGCNFTGTDSLMPPTVCQLREAVTVTKGQPVLLHISFSYGTSLEEASFEVSPKVGGNRS